MTMPRNRIRELRTVRGGDLKAGTTIIAAERQNRACYAMEIDPGYVDAAVKRWEAYTGEKGVRDGS